MTELELTIRKMSNDRNDELPNKPVILVKTCNFWDETGEDGIKRRVVADCGRTTYSFSKNYVKPPRPK